MLERPVEITATNALDQLPAEMSTGIGWARAGGAAYVTDHMPRVLGRPAGTFEQWARDHWCGLALGCGLMVAQR
ncbi:hypothetical protein QBB34_01540 [Streptomyces stelliscabiei]|uniref:hypothetical protein n=1 Tax=Streptomyces TaxID=1883 RepID=UPI00211BCF72|nr:hypothetical protein [Streptomyces sp. 1222.2]